MALRDRLERLDRAPPRPAPPNGDLRRRLDNLLATGLVVPAARLEPRVKHRGTVTLEGRGVTLPSGPCFLCETTLSRDDHHGRLPLASLDGVAGIGALTLFPEHLAGLGGPEGLAFLDTETTGLAGGAGTVAFLIGVARWQGGRFRIAQLFLEDLDREPALLDALAEELRGVKCVVTYNGASYDLPLLQNRHVLNRRRWPLTGVRHLDLLPAARALWRHGHPDCRLTTLERGVLGYERHGDIPGAEIPAIYTRYLRKGPDHELLAVFRHNRWDLLSLAGLLWASGEAAAAPAGTAGLGVGLLHVRRGRDEQGRDALESSLRGGLPHAPKLRALKDLALACKRAGDWGRALDLWAELGQLAPGGDPSPVVESAKALERWLGEPERALALVDEALRAHVWSAADRRALETRRQRLEQKLRKRAQPQPNEESP